MVTLRQDLDRPLTAEELDSNFSTTYETILTHEQLLSERLLNEANLDNKINELESKQIDDVLRLEVAAAQATTDQIEANALLDGKITQVEQATIDASNDVTDAYKEYMNVVLKAMADGVLTPEEESLILLARANIDANNLRLQNIQTDILSASTEASQAGILAAAADGKITAEEQARVAAILQEEQSRVTAIADRIEAEANLDGKITIAEQATIDAANQLEKDYIEYNRIVTLALADGVLTPEEEALIADALANVNASKQKVIELQLDVSSLSTDLSAHAVDIANLDGKIDDVEAAAIARALATETVMAQDKADRIEAEALLDGKITASEQNLIDASRDIESAYKEYSRITMLALSDGVLTEEEEALILGQRAYIDATKARMDSIETNVNTLSNVDDQLLTDISNLLNHVDTEDVNLINKIANEQAARAADILERVQAEALLDGKITAEEQFRIDSAIELEAGYKNYSNIIQKALADGVLTQEEKDLIADAQLDITIQKDRLASLDTTLSSLAAKDIELQSYIDDTTYIDDKHAAALLAISDEQVARTAAMNERIAAEAALDDKITDEEAARIEAGQNLEIGYKKYNNLIQKSLADGELTQEEKDLIADAQLDIDATKDRFTTINLNIAQTNLALADEAAARAVLDGKITDEESNRVAALLAESAARAADIADRVAAEAALDGKITDEELARNAGLSDLETNYKEHVNIVMKYMADGVITDEEAALISLSKANIDATRARIDGIESLIDTNNQTINNALDALDTKVTSEEAARIQALADEAAARASDIADRVSAESSLDYKITAAEQATINAANQLEIDYKNYSNIIQKALSDGELTQEEKDLIAEAQSDIDATKARMSSIETQIVDNTNLIASEISSTLDKVDAETAARIQALADEQTARADENAALVAADAALDGKIDYNEQERLAANAQLTLDYKNYSNVIQKAMSDGVLTDDETLLIADAQSAINATKERIVLLENNINDLETSGAATAALVANVDDKITTEEQSRITAILAEESARIQETNDRIAAVLEIDGKITEVEQKRIDLGNQLETDYKNYSNIMIKSLSDGVLTSDEQSLINDAQDVVDATKKRILDIDTNASQAKKQVEFSKIVFDKYIDAPYNNTIYNDNTLLTIGETSNTFSQVLSQTDNTSSPKLNPINARYVDTLLDSDYKTHSIHKHLDLYFAILQNTTTNNIIIKMFTKEYDNTLRLDVLTEQGSIDTDMTIIHDIRYNEHSINIFDGNILKLFDWSLNLIISKDIYTEYSDNSAVVGVDIGIIYMNIMGDYLNFYDGFQSYSFNLLTLASGFKNEVITFESTTITKKIIQLTEDYTLYLSSNYVALFLQGELLNISPSKYSEEVSNINVSFIDDLIYIIYSKNIVIYSYIDLLHLQTLSTDLKVNSIIKHENYILLYDGVKIYRGISRDLVQSPEVFQANPFADINYRPTNDESLITKKYLKTQTDEVFQQALLFRKTDEYFDIIYDEINFKFYCYLNGEVIGYLPEPADTEYRNFKLSNFYIDNVSNNIHFSAFRNEIEVYNFKMPLSGFNEAIFINSFSMTNKKPISYLSKDLIFYNPDPDNAIIFRISDENTYNLSNIKISYYHPNYYRSINDQYILYIDINNDIKFINIDGAEFTISPDGANIKCINIKDNALYILDTYDNQYQYVLDFANLTATSRPNILFPMFTESIVTDTYIFELVDGNDTESYGEVFSIWNMYNKEYVLLDSIALKDYISRLYWHDTKLIIECYNNTFAWTPSTTGKFASISSLDVISSRMDSIDAQMVSISSRMDDIDAGGFQNQIDDEISNRQSADNALDNRLSAVENNIENLDISVEESARIDADDLLRSSISSNSDKITSINSTLQLTVTDTPLKNLKDLVDSHESAINNLELQSVETERNDRIAADDAETSAREAAVQSLNDRIDDLASVSIASEETARIDADNILTDSITLEASTRISDVNDLQSKIDIINTNFENYDSTGINMVPVNTKITINNNPYGRFEILFKISNTGLTDTSTIQDFKNLESNYRTIDVGSLDFGSF